jgi:multidrug efflux system membrane fusion protein
VSQLFLGRCAHVDYLDIEHQSLARERMVQVHVDVKLRMGRAKSEQALLVSERAVGTDQSKRFVFVVGPDNKAIWREVTLGGTANGQRIVTSGLEPGERIVVNGLQRVRPGALLQPQPAS